MPRVAWKNARTRGVWTGALDADGQRIYYSKQEVGAVVKSLTREELDAQMRAIFCDDNLRDYPGWVKIAPLCATPATEKFWRTPLMLPEIKKMIWGFLCVRRKRTSGTAETR